MKNMIFDACYIRGYTAAIQDMLDVIGYIQIDLKRNKVKQDSTTYKKIMECMLKNRAVLRENPDAFIRYNCVSKDFEVYISNS